jgi:hypothetical protein
MKPATRTAWEYHTLSPDRGGEVAILRRRMRLLLHQRINHQLSSCIMVSFRQALKQIATAYVSFNHTRCTSRNSLP